MGRSENVFHLSYCRRVLRLLIAGLISTVMFIGMLDLAMSHATGNQPSFSLTPVTSPAPNRSYFIINTKKGASVVNQVRITNTGTMLGSIMLYAVDATTGQTSGLVYLNQTDPRSDVGAWITLNTTQLTLAPQQSQVVSFQLTVPATARSGEHVGGIVAQNVQSQSGASGGPIQVSTGARLIITVQVELGPPLIDLLSVTGISSSKLNGYQIEFVGLINNGNTLLKSYGTLQVLDSTNQLRMNVPLQLDTILPQTAISYPVYVQNQTLAIGTYTANLVLHYGVNRTLNYTTTFQVSS